MEKCPICGQLVWCWKRQEWPNLVLHLSNSMLYCWLVSFCQIEYQLYLFSAIQNKILHFSSILLLSYNISSLWFQLQILFLFLQFWKFEMWSDFSTLNVSKILRSIFLFKRVNNILSFIHPCKIYKFKLIDITIWSYIHNWGILCMNFIRTELIENLHVCFNICFSAIQFSELFSFSSVCSVTFSESDLTTFSPSASARFLTTTVLEGSSALALLRASLLLRRRSCHAGPFLDLWWLWVGRGGASPTLRVTLDCPASELINKLALLPEDVLTCQ